MSTTPNTALPFSQAADNNKEAIAAVLANWIADRARVLEIGTGTAQHAVYFAELFPHVSWQCADQLAYHPVIKERIALSGLSNLLPPLELEVMQFDWSSVEADLVFTANTAHIMSWTAVVVAFSGIAKTLTHSGALLWYGPFNRDGKFTSESNARFHAHLQSEGPHMGIRDVSAMEDQAHQNGLDLVDSVQMPANNQLLVFVKSA